MASRRFRDERCAQVLGVAGDDGDIQGLGEHVWRSFRP